MNVAIHFEPRVSGVVLEQGKGALYRETLQATGCYVGWIVIATAEFAPMPPLPLPGYPGGLIPTAIGMRFRRHDGIYRSDVAQTPNPGYGIQPPPAGRPRAQVKERVGRTTLFSSSAMSSGRLFLDRVGRHQWHTRRGRLDKEERNSMRVGSRYPDKCPASAVKTAGSMVPSKARPPVWFRASCSTQ